VIASIEQVGGTIKYSKGKFQLPEGRTATVLDEGSLYRLYFVNDEYRTSFRVSISKSDLAVNVVFEEFGVRALSGHGLEQYQRLMNSLMNVFGKESVVAGNANNSAGL